MERSPEELVRIARRARLDGDDRAAERAAAEAWLLCERRIRLQVLRKAKRPLADEVMSDVMERFARWLYTTDVEAVSLIAILSTIAQRALADAYRRRPREDLVEHDPGAGGDAGLEHVLDRAEVEELLGHLSERERELIEAVYLRDEPRDEVAARLGVTTNNLYQIQFRALNRLRALAEERR